MSWPATITTCLINIGLILGAFSWATDGFAVLTTEEARRRSVAREMPELPSLKVESLNGTKGDWRQILKSDDRVTIMHFVYTRCRTLCFAQTAQTLSLQRLILEKSLAGDIQLTTISFDPQNDTFEVLKRYAQRFEIQPEIWSLWRPSNQKELDAVLAALGIIVIPDNMGEYVHNAAWLIVDRQARLRAIVPQEHPLRALQLAQQMSL
jgi:protein SCO1/2